MRVPDPAPKKFKNFGKKKKDVGKPNPHIVSGNGYIRAHHRTISDAERAENERMSRALQAAEARVELLRRRGLAQ